MYMIFWCKNNFYWPVHRADHVPGNLKRFLNRDPWSQRRLYLCHISDNLFHTFFHSLSLLSLFPCLAEYLPRFSRSLPSLRLLERRKRQEGNGLPRRRVLYPLKIISRSRFISRESRWFRLVPSRVTNHPIGRFPLCPSSSCARRLSLSIGSTNQRAWSSGHDATVLQREPTDRTVLDSLPVNSVACVGWRVC